MKLKEHRAVADDIASIPVTSPLQLKLGLVSCKKFRELLHIILRNQLEFYNMSGRTRHSTSVGLDCAELLIAMERWEEAINILKTHLTSYTKRAWTTLALQTISLICSCQIQLDAKENFVQSCISLMQLNSKQMQLSLPHIVPMDLQKYNHVLHMHCQKITGLECNLEGIVRWEVLGLGPDFKDNPAHQYFAGDTIELFFKLTNMTGSEMIFDRADVTLNLCVINQDGKSTRTRRTQSRLSASGLLLSSNASGDNASKIRLQPGESTLCLTGVASCFVACKALLVSLPKLYMGGVSFHSNAAQSQDINRTMFRIIRHPYNNWSVDAVYPPFWEPSQVQQVKFSIFADKVDHIYCRIRIFTCSFIQFFI